ncbi:MAG: hypothetical protein KatS3mg105_3103 [Gemmatales bacterium]|nr:MAG: hypothetical protein KatS3mg105_3103 [Gemmatales bacterium]
MSRSRFLAGLLAVSLLFVGGLSGQEKKKAFKGRLPAGWSKLGITDKQRQSIYAVQKKYYDKIKELERQIEELKTAEREEMIALLSDLQKQRLKEIESEQENKNKKKRKDSPSIKPPNDKNDPDN